MKCGKSDQKCDLCTLNVYNFNNKYQSDNLKWSFFNFHTYLTYLLKIGPYGPELIWHIIS